MGSFMGHILPGSFFLGFGLWWTWKVLHRYFVSILQRPIKGANNQEGIEFRNTVARRYCFCGKERPMESYTVILLCSIGIIGEVYTGFDDQHHFVHFGNAQHITMFFFFALAGVVDVLQHHKYPIPPDSDYVVLVMAFTMEGLIFYHHLHGRDHMDVQLHMLFVYSIFFTIISTCFEMSLRRNVLPGLGRAYATILQGTWMYQIAFVLYPPYPGHEWNTKDHRQMVLITCMFGLHIAAILVFMMFACCFCYGRAKCTLRSRSY